MNATTTEGHARVASNLIPVTHVSWGGRNQLYVPVPNGWPDVQRLVGKVLVYDYRTYAFTGWDSDRLEAYFQPKAVATVKNA